MEIIFRYRLEDFEELCVHVDALHPRAQRLRRGYIGVGFLLVMLPFLAGGSFLQPDTRLWWTVPFGLLLMWSGRYTPKKWARERYGTSIYDYDYRAVISESGIITSSPTVKTDLQWAAFWGYYKTENVLALLYESVMYLFPRRAFSPEEWQAFTEMVERKLPLPTSQSDKK